MSSTSLYYSSGALYAEIQENERRYLYENGQLKTLEPYKEGKLNGEVRLYWPNGVLKRLSEFRKGSRHGKDQMWSENGTLLDEGSYEHGKPVGIHRRFTEKGELIEEAIYLDSLRFNLKVWDEMGTLHFEGLWNQDDYVEKTWDRFQNKWNQKKGRWDGKKVVFF
ncbi:MAG: hypothetical protein FJZ64_03610 [Chlamydiae bacterium]|nr:hypothetical protein [Chlamydiota bacterium]